MLLGVLVLRLVIKSRLKCSTPINFCKTLLVLLKKFGVTEDDDNEADVFNGGGVAERYCSGS